MGIRRRVWELVETAEGDDPASRLIDVLIVGLILSSTIVVIVDSIPGFLARVAPAVRTFEVLVVIIFSVEYALRIWSCTADQRYSHPLKGRIRFALTPLALVDLVAITPFYLPWILPRGLLFLRVLRLVRLLRLFKVGRYSSAPRLVIRAFRRRRAEMLAALFVLFLVLISMASLLYLTESPGRPDVYSSIPVSIWWSILALTGNGQVAPITLAGRLIASAMAIIGVGLFALPAGLLASAFTEELGGRPPDAGVGDDDVERVTTRVVLAHAERRHGRWDPDEIASDYDEAALILTNDGVWRGPSGGVEAVAMMRDQAGERSWMLEKVQVAGIAALLHWRAEQADGSPLEAVETLVVREGLIELQSIDIVPNPLSSS